MTRVITLLLLLSPPLLTGCENAPGPASDAASADQGAEISPLEEAKALEAAGKRVLAYQKYVTLLQDMDPADPQFEDLRAKVKHLAFILGVPDGADTLTHTLPPKSDDKSRQPNIERAQSLYNRAQADRKAGDAKAALKGYDAVLKMISAEDHAELYWNAYQAKDELTPQAPVNNEPGDGDGDGDGDDEAVDLTAAQRHYMDGQSLSEMGRYKEASRAYRQALEAAQGSDDPLLESAIKEGLRASEARLLANP